MGEGHRELSFTINMPRETSYTYRIDGEEHPMQPGAPPDARTPSPALSLCRHGFPSYRL